MWRLLKQQRMPKGIEVGSCALNSWWFGGVFPRDVITVEGEFCSEGKARGTGK